MAKIIEFYVPSNFRRNMKWTPMQERGKLIEFSLDTKQSPDPVLRGLARFRID